MNESAPVLVLNFNRPDFTLAVIERLRESKPKKIYFAVDGPRIENKEDAFLVESVRELAKTIDWETELRTRFSEKNMGCKHGVKTAIDWVFEREETAIILEDDTLPDSSFLQFATELLKKYESEESIAMISGNNFGKYFFPISKSYGFSRYSHIWGWATWRRAWRDYREFPDIERFRNCDFPDSKSEKVFWERCFKGILDGSVDTWDYQWAYTNFILKRMSIVPKVNLVSNQGFRSDASHTKIQTKNAFLPTVPLKFPLKHPNRIKPSQVFERASRRSFFQ